MTETVLDDGPVGGLPPEPPRRGNPWFIPAVLACVASLLALILVPNFIKARARGQLTACKSNLKNIGTALDMCSSDHKGLYPRTLLALTPDYLRVLPRCPGAGRETYSESYQVSADAKRFTFFCRGHNHANANIRENYPEYTSEAGLIER